MGRVYAGILGMLAMAVVICRGWLGSSGIETTLSLAVTYLVLFSVVGAIIGQIAQATVDESVRVQLQKQLMQQGENVRG